MCRTDRMTSAESPVSRSAAPGPSLPPGAAPAIDECLFEYPPIPAPNVVCWHPASDDTWTCWAIGFTREEAYRNMLAQLMNAGRKRGHEMSSNPLAGRTGLRTESASTNALACELGQLAKRNKLRGCVLISFTGDRVGVNSSGVPNGFGRQMEQLGDRLLAAIDDGLFDPADGIYSDLWDPHGDHERDLAGCGGDDVRDLPVARGRKKTAVDV